MSDTVVLKVEWRGESVQVTAVDEEGQHRGSLGLRPPAKVDVVCAAVAKVSHCRVSAVELSAAPGLVVLDRNRRMPCPPLVGDEPDTSPDAGWLRKQLPGGDDDWVAAVGSAPAAGWTLSKLSFVHRSRADVWEQLQQVLTPQAWLAHSLTGAAVTDAADAASIGAWSPAGGYRWDLLAIVDKDRDWTGAMPAVVAAGDDLGMWRGVPVRAAARP